MSYYQKAEDLLNRNKSDLTRFLTDLHHTLNPKNTLLLLFSGLNVFKSLRFNNCVSVETEEKLDSEHSEYEVILGDLPFNINKVDSEVHPKSKVNKNWDLLYRRIQKLKTNGLAIFLVEPAILFSAKGLQILKTLEENGFVYNAAFNTPENILQPITAFRPILLAFSTESTSKIFIGEIGNHNDLLIRNFLSKSDSQNLETGKLIDKADFHSLSGYMTDSQIKNLKVQYADYEIYKLSELVLAIYKTKQKFEELPNSIYVTKVGASKVISSLDNAIHEHQNYFQIQLDETIVLADYLPLFYQSKLGKLILDSLNSGSFIPRISKSAILDSQVAVPSIEKQRVLIHTSTKLRGLQKIIDELQTEIGLNPKNVKAILEKYDTIKEPLKSLSMEDEVLGIIRKGEGKSIEFKQTFSKNIRTLKKDVDIEKASLKTMIGFMNTHGGTLLIGVSDKGVITGIEEDIFNSQDSYLLHFRNSLNSKLGAEFYPLMDYDIITVMGKMVLKVVCSASRKPCFYDKKEFFVRTNPATDKLEGQQLVEYIAAHFK